MTARTSAESSPLLNAMWIALLSVLLVRTKSEPMMDAMIPAAEMSSGRMITFMAPASGNCVAATATPRTIAAMIEPTYDS